ncbi:hypothetical protein N0V93_002696 [Gnomoniopsis smithogilvyi]|uniref:Uncharacterized protein n=1 Tax=Gnomoniopsis smithogilvyi TaxID=1191159 RepID=A0A9W8YV99_9PEZI|nr:hypothetical protein N0V93_002696 [Gnomoniopsis smithogilvyi]
MGRRLSTWLILIRSFQVLGSFVPGAVNGWLLYYLYTNRLGPSELMLLLEVLIAIIFGHNFLSVLIIHTSHRSRQTAWIIATVCFDVVLCFVDLTIVSLLSYSGLPSNCSGLTSSTWSKGDKVNLPSRGYSTIRFSDEQDGHRGELDKFCGLERGFFFCAVLIILAYILGIITSVFRICDLKYTRNEEVELLLREREETLKLELKLQDQELQSQPCIPAPASTPESTTRRHNVAEATAAAKHALMSRPSVIHSPSSSSIPSSSRFKGMNLASIPESSAHRHTYISVSPRPAVATSSASVGQSSLMASDMTDFQANLAMVSDGSRYSGGNQVDSSQLPPYSPGNLRTMSGHRNENNDIRLSEYVKGETRAQDMKDGGGF